MRIVLNSLLPHPTKIQKIKAQNKIKREEAEEKSVGTMEFCAEMVGVLFDPTLSFDLLQSI